MKDNIKYAVGISYTNEKFGNIIYTRLFNSMCADEREKNVYCGDLVIDHKNKDIQFNVYEYSDFVPVVTYEKSTIDDTGIFVVTIAEVMVKNPGRFFDTISHGTHMQFRGLKDYTDDLITINTNHRSEMIVTFHGGSKFFPVVNLIYQEH